jgi:hypothetical protein
MASARTDSIRTIDMAREVPKWFAADSFFQGTDGWYVGSQNGLRVGPYADSGAAEIASRNVCMKIRRARTTRDVVGVVRSFLGSEAASLRTGGNDKVRAGEDQRSWHRSRRVFNVNGLWFIATREEIDVGPYVSVAEAERDAKLLLSLLSHTESEAASRLAIYEFMHRPRARRHRA